jgi:hypothetical protein
VLFASACGVDRRPLEVRQLAAREGFGGRADEGNEVHTAD